jgi:ferredoxin
MKIVVDYDRCESNGVCMSIVPEIFEVRDDDFMYVLDEHPPEKYWAKVHQAVNSCPTQALSLVEDDESEAASPGKGTTTVAKPAAGGPDLLVADGGDEGGPAEDVVREDAEGAGAAAIAEEGEGTAGAGEA